MKTRFEPAGECRDLRRFVHGGNGLELVVRQERSAPVAAVLVVYRVGSRNEAVGHTGATHLLEHMLFKGTPTHNRQNGTQIASVLERVGADFNATTWYDRTNYFETVPADQLEFALALEADRMRNSLIDDADRQAEMTVVRNELERGENDPLTVLDQLSHATAFREHPYHHPTIGWRSDVEGVPTARLRAFYDTYYWPDNASLIVVGDVDLDQVLELAERHFGVIGRAPIARPEVYTVEPEQEGERRFVLQRSGAEGLVMLSFRTPEAAHEDTAPLAILQGVLGIGRSSRLYRMLVDSQIASDASAWCETFHDPGLFQLVAHLLPNVTHADAERALLIELARLRDEPIAPHELEKARRLVLTRLVYGREGAGNFAYQLSEAIASVSWRWLYDFEERLCAVTSADAQRVARTYFRRKAMTVAWFVPRARSVDDGLSGAQSAPEVNLDGAPPLKESAAEVTVAPVRLSPTRPHVERSFEGRTHRRQFANGMVAVVLESAAAPTVAARIQLRAGVSSCLPAGRVLADVTARMLQRGTSRCDAIRFATELEGLGIDANASSGPFTVCIEAHALSQDVDAMLGALAEMLREPAFPVDELGKVKAELAAEVRRNQHSTSVRAYQRLTQLILDPANPYFVPEAEATLDELDALDIDAVLGHYESAFGGATATAVVVGDVEADAVLDCLERSFGDWRAGESRPVVEPPTPAPGVRRDTVVVPDKANADVVVGQVLPLRRRDADFIPFQVANAIVGQSSLSSRLGLRVRDTEGLTYGIRSHIGGATLIGGLWYVTVTVQPANVERALVSTLDVIARSLDDGLTEREVDDYRSNFIGSFKVGLASHAGLAAALAEAEFYGFGPRYLDDYPAMVSAVTCQQVNAAWLRLLTPDQFVTVVAGELDAG
jgi:zinc protease